MSSLRKGVAEGVIGAKRSESEREKKKGKGRKG